MQLTAEKILYYNVYILSRVYKVMPILLQESWQ